ncbi:MAG: npr [Thermoleophilia bacterium]|nr:npr [Thermoleophilia bacterium]
MEIGQAQLGTRRHAPAHDVSTTAREIPVEVWVPGADNGLDVVAQKSGGPASADRDVQVAFENGRRVLEYVRTEYGRSSFDGKGSPLKLRVHAPDPMTNDPRSNNAFWFNDEQRIWLGDGDGEMFAPLGGGADVIAHEFFHGVIDSEIRLAYSGQSGALHESFSDVLASGIDGNWQIGEDVYTPGVAGDALRDLSKLTWTDWRTFPGGEDEVHAMSEVPSHAAYLIGSKLGAKELRHLWYVALTDHLRSESGFAGARDATISAARAIYGARSTQTQAVMDAWAAVGIDATTPTERPLVPPTAAVAAASTSVAALVPPLVR